MVGSSLAAGLAQHPVMVNTKIVLLEGAPEKPQVSLPTGQFTNRVSALNPNTAEFLEGLGAWTPHISQKCHPFSRMFVWEECSPANIEFKSDDGAAVAHMVENDVTVAALTTVMKQACQPDRLQVVYGARIEAVELHDTENPLVKMQDGRTIEARLVVGADGANSVVRRAMGGHYFSKDYNQMGVVATLTFDRPFDNDTAYQKFMTEGPIAVLPLSPTQSSLVWTVPRSWAPAMTKDWSKDEFVAKLNQSLKRTSYSPLVEGANALLGSLIQSTVKRSAVEGPVMPPPIVGVDNVAAFPLGTGLPERSVSRSRAVLVGDAFHRVHPLAGQGVNLGFGDADCLVRTLADGVRKGRPLADHVTLCDYETQRLRHNLPTMAAIDGLQKLYCTDNQLFVLARSLGLQVVNSNTSLKGLALNQASN